MLVSTVCVSVSVCIIAATKALDTLFPPVKAKGDISDTHTYIHKAAYP